MPRGLPDWDRIKKAGAVSALADLGELAVRLGSIVSFDRRGDVVWLGGFEDGLARWYTSTAGTGAAVALSPARARSGGYSVLLTGGSDGNRSAGIYYTGPYIVLGKLGVECSFCFDSHLDTLKFALEVYDGSTFYQAVLKYDYTNLKLQYLDADNDYQDLATSLNLYQILQPFNTWKLVCDVESGEYMRVILNETEYDCSGIEIKSAASGAVPHLALWVVNNSTAGWNAEVHVDDVIVTQNEP